MKADNVVKASGNPSLTASGASTLAKSSDLPNQPMPFEKTEDLIRLAFELNGTAEGLSLQDIQDRYRVARRADA